MTRYRRHYVPGATWFFTVALADRSSTLLTDEITLLRQAWAEVARRYPFTTVAACILPDHLHAIWSLPEGDSDYSLRWSLIKRFFSRNFPSRAAPGSSKARKREKNIWQRRFWEYRIRNDADLERHVNYIHFNPVRHGQVSQASDWPHSSFHRFVEQGQLPPNWGGTVTGTGKFGE